MGVTSASEHAWDLGWFGLFWAVKAQATGLIYNDFAYSSACTAPAHWQYNFLLLRCSRRRRKLAQLSLAATAPQAAAASPVCRGTAATTVCLRQLSACLPTFFYIPTHYQIACYTSRVSEFLVTVWPEPIWIKVNGWWQILPQHQSTYLTGPESASIETQILPLYSARLIYWHFWLPKKIP